MLWHSITRRAGGIKGAAHIREVDANRARRGHEDIRWVARPGPRASARGSHHTQGPGRKPGASLYKRQRLPPLCCGAQDSEHLISRTALARRQWGHDVVVTIATITSIVVSAAPVPSGDAAAAARELRGVATVASELGTLPKLLASLEEAPYRDPPPPRPVSGSRRPHADADMTAHEAAAMSCFARAASIDVAWEARTRYEIYE